MATAGPWTLGEVIATHRHACVYRSGNPYVMIATLAPQADAQTREELIREPRASNLTASEMLFDVIDAGVMGDGTLYLAMELVPGKLLSEVLRERPRHAPDAVIRFGTVVLGMLAAIHARGIVHGELRPDAILVAPDGRPRVLHVGVAQLAAMRDRRLQIEGGMRGWAPYETPERIEDKPQDARSDVYGVGTLLYEIATGVPAFDGDSLPAILNAHFAKRPKPPRKLVPGLPAVLDRVILRALERDPADRFASADEMRAALLA